MGNASGERNLGLRRGRDANERRVRFGQDRWSACFLVSWKSQRAAVAPSSVSSAFFCVETPTTISSRSPLLLFINEWGSFRRTGMPSPLWISAVSSLTVLARRR